MTFKTLDQWIAEADKYSGICYDKYVKAWNDLNCPESARNYYCNASKHYGNLRDLLQHIKRYGLRTGLIATQQCAACKSNPYHAESLIDTYSKYQKWINALIMP